MIDDQPNTIGALSVTAARTTPTRCTEVDIGVELLAGFGAVVGLDDDPGESTRISNSLRGLLTGTHSALEPVLAPLPQG